MNANEIIPQHLRQHFISVFELQSIQFTEEIQECRIRGFPDIAHRLYEAADLLDAIDLEAPELTWDELFSKAKAVTDLHYAIRNELRNSNDE